MSALKCYSREEAQVSQITPGTDSSHRDKKGDRMQRGSLRCRDSRGWETWCFPTARKCLESLSMVTGKSPALSWLCQVGLGPSSTLRTGQPGWVSTAKATRGVWVQPQVSTGHRWLGAWSWTSGHSWQQAYPLCTAVSLCRFANSPVECSYALELLICSDFALSLKAPEVKQILI